VEIGGGEILKECLPLASKRAEHQVDLEKGRSRGGPLQRVQSNLKFGDDNGRRKQGGSKIKQAPPTATTCKTLQRQSKERTGAAVPEKIGVVLSLS